MTHPPSPHYSDSTVSLHHGDCLDVLRSLPDASVDAVVTDPPYGLEFMGKEWDSFKPTKENACATPTEPAPTTTATGAPAATSAAPTTASSAAPVAANGGRTTDPARAASATIVQPDAIGGFQDGNGGNAYSRSRVRTNTQRHGGDSLTANQGFQRWCEQWTAECLRVLKPGGHLLAFGGTRTWHRLACAVEDAGFEVRDSLAWLYGSGFPKSLDVSKAIDKAAGAEREVLGMRNRILNRTPSAKWVKSNEPSEVRQGDAGLTAGSGVWSEVTAPATPDAERWQGWGTALKPAFEPIVVARKPLSGTVAANVLQWGCGALNINATRVGPDGGSSQGGSREAGARGCVVHPLRGVRDGGQEASLDRGAAEVAEHLRTEVHGATDARPAEPELDGRRLDRQADGLSARRGRQPLGRGQGATADATPAGVPGTPAGDGAEDRAPADVGRDGASHQRREGGQPAGESAPDGLGGSLPGAPSDRAGTDATPSGERSPASCTCGADREVTRAGEASADRRYTERGGTNFAPLPGVRGGSPLGRWPANVILDESQAEVLDGQSGVSRTGGAIAAKADVPRDEGDFLSRMKDAGNGNNFIGDIGGASRFFYVAKADKSERVRVDGVAHPTVKPLDVMRWLVRLVTPPGGTVLDPFAGSGTTVEACILEGFKCIAIEREETYLPLVKQRIHRRRDPVEAVKSAGEDGGLFDLLGEGA